TLKEHRWWWMLSWVNSAGPCSARLGFSSRETSAAAPRRTGSGGAAGAVPARSRAPRPAHGRVAGTGAVGTSTSDSVVGRRAHRRAAVAGDSHGGHGGVPGVWGTHRVGARTHGVARPVVVARGGDRPVGAAAGHR